MPRLFRPMKRADDGLPIVGTESKQLGVRVPPNEYADIDLDADGNVVLNDRGMSVASHWRHLRPHLIPKRLRDSENGAVGLNTMSVYRFGEGEFGNEKINEHLVLAMKSTSAKQGNVVPASLMQLDEFLGHIADTRDHWIVDEQ